jgi:hypothetical protein
MKGDLDFQILNSLQTKFRRCGVKKYTYFNSDYMGSNEVRNFEVVLADIRNDKETSCCLDNELFIYASSGKRNKHLQLTEQTQPVLKHYVKETAMDNLKRTETLPFL